MPPLQVGRNSGAGTGVGALATAIYAHVRGWSVGIPPRAWAGGLATAVITSAAAGLLPQADRYTSPRPFISGANLRAGCLVLG